MKKVVRTVWISLLSGLAFLVACSCQNKLTRAEKKQLKAERTALIEQIEKKQQEAAVYERPDEVMSVKQDELQLRNRLDEINVLLGDKQAVIQNGNQISKINQQIDSLQKAYDESMIVPCVYGPPIDDPGYKAWQKERLIKDLSQQLDSIQNILRKREGACVYGSPEIIKKYSEETQRLRQEAENIRKQLEEAYKEE